jgi:hypothetical protein
METVWSSDPERLTSLPIPTGVQRKSYKGIEGISRASIREVLQDGFPECLSKFFLTS